MQLKKIIIKGFKSFADKTILEFNDGVTGVVGPNGSGKSNIIEAIQWVMGEQSAKSLRGGKMNDVIFSGTSTRKPMNIAQVTIVLDNTTRYLPVDYEEVSVTRRLSRSGESDYFINKQSCRLKDIVDLFMDSGLGKESFSIISQGKVEAIFNSKPEDRRAIFEEAAGVFKYKTHKKEAERKLDDTQGNLDRVQDILYELEAQVEPLRQQADIAKTYLDQKEQLTDSDINLSVMKIEKLTKEIEECREKLKEYGGALEKIESEAGTYDRKVTEVKSSLSDITEQREQLQTDMIQKVQEIERTESSLALFEEKAKHKEEFIEEKQQSIRNQERRIQELETELEEKTAEASKQKALVDDWNEKIKEKKEHLGYLEKGADERIEELREIYLDLMQMQAALNNEEQSLTRDISKQKIQVEKSKKQKNELEDNLEAEKTELEEKTGELSTLQQEIKDLLADFQTLSGKNEEMKDAARSKEERLNSLSGQLGQARAKQTSLREMQDNYAGYFAGVKAIMQNKEELPGIVGTVADLIQIPKDYLEAIDTTLSSSSQFIVVKDEKAGRQAIQYLKKRNAGRATFLPLTTIRPRKVPAESIRYAKEEPGFIGIASDLIEYDESVASIIQNLLGNTIVAKSLEAANKIARAVSYRFRVVSLDGNVMNAGGSMTGGGGRRSSNSHLFTQKDELKKLAVFIDETTKTIDFQKKLFEEEQAKRSGCKKELQRVREAGEQKRYSENQLENELKSAEESVCQIERRLKVLSFEERELVKDLKDNQSRLEEVRTEKEDVKERLGKTSDEMTLLTSEKEDSETRKIGLNEEIDQLRSELIEKREAYASSRTTVSSLTSQLHQYEETLKQLEADIKAYEEGEVTGSKEELTEQLTALNTAYDQQKNREKELKENQTELNEFKDRLEKELDEVQQHQQYISEEKNSMQVRQSRADVNLDHQLEYLAEEYGISYEEARMTPDSKMDFEAAEKKVKLLKKGMAELGPVNLNSIEEYEKVSERYDFLNKQQTDLIEAKTQLMNTMDQMDNEVKRRFKKKFDEIKEQFAIVFPQMFGGGKAELRLTDPKDLLTSGVEIAAQPPGKKLSSLSLLSGGERALTAISLLFAIVQVSQVPFCILDEAEAALDESNVERFGKYLKNFDTKTQFIVITHRKGTMEEADTLYGITMQEQGVSSVVSVRLEDVDEMELAGKA